jgi:hypothetical protein
MFVLLTLVVQSLSLVNANPPRNAGPGPLQKPKTRSKKEKLPHVEREFRAVWMATVDNIDFPNQKNPSPAQKMQELPVAVDLAKGERLNAVVFEALPVSDTYHKPHRLIRFARLLFDFIRSRHRILGPGYKRMKQVLSVVGILAVMLAVLSCGLINRFTNGGVENLQRAENLWPDVPRMDGLNDSPTEDLPITIKLVLHTFVNMVLNSDKDQKKHVSTDWIFYKYNGSDTDIKNFYTPEKMKSGGNWSLPQDLKSACVDGKEKGLPGEVCLYQKTEGGKQQGLIIIALPTQEKDVPVFVYFLRAETEADQAG